MSLNRACVGKQYPSVAVTVTATATQQYARAYNDDNPAFFDTGRPGGVIAPPMFAVVVTWQSLMTAVMDPEVGTDFLRLVHGEQDMEFLAPIHAGDRITSTARIISMEERATGETMTIELVASNQLGARVQRTLFSVFIRGGSRRLVAPEARAEEPDRGDPLLTVSQTIDADQTYRYAEASGDRNPIHVDENVAKMAGLPGIIVHGLCTMAFTSKVVIDNLCKGDPRRLRGLRVRFSRPVRPGETITTRVWEESRNGTTKVYAYETSNSEGQTVIRGGTAEVAQ